MTKWFANPGIGPIVLLGLSVGAAYGITFLSTGLGNKPALRSAQSMAVIGLLLYYPNQYIFNHAGGVLTIVGLALLTALIGVGVSRYWAKIDRGPVTRTAILTGVVIGILTIIDKLMQTFKPYIETDAINGRPVPTISESNSLLPPGNFWFTFLDTLLHLFLPTIALALISFAGYVRYSRGTLLEVMNQDYIRTARAKGLTERTVIMRHAFRNTLIPLTTIIVVDFAAIIGGAIITERVFGWRGMGTLFNKAISDFDLNLLMGVFFVTSTLAVLANLAADLLYSALDPRIRVVGKS
ncbi:unannotated protein [freshwater metagenome]|uniref:Unannotated protein n=1 Tax=freshwater metagenome TaxID=449393 RepID=A0A6J7FDJ7_9ZZZZ